MTTKLQARPEKGDQVTALSFCDGRCSAGDTLTILVVGNRHSVSCNWDFWVSGPNGRRFGVNDYEIK